MTKYSHTMLRHFRRCAVTSLALLPRFTFNRFAKPYNLFQLLLYL